MGCKFQSAKNRKNIGAQQNFPQLSAANELNCGAIWCKKPDRARKII
jgi:hypothetical protein